MKLGPVDLLFPAGLWLGLAALGVLLAHLRRRRARRIEVPFLHLWTAAAAQRGGGVGRRVLRVADLLLVLAACAAVALAAARPVLPGDPGRVRDLVLVLDGGVELRAEDRLERARAVAREEVARRVAGSRVVTVGVRDEGPYVTAGLHEHEAGWLALDPAPALDVARRAAEWLREPDLVFVTFRDLRPEGFRLRAVGGPVPNAGFSGVEVLDDPEGGGRLARVSLRGRGPAEIEGRWRGMLPARVDLPLPPSGRVELRLSAEGDAFPHDDVVRLDLRSAPPPRALLVADRAPSVFLVAALEAMRATGLLAAADRTAPERFPEAAAGYDVAIFDAVVPDAPPGIPAIYLAPPRDGPGFFVGREISDPPLVHAEPAHPLLAGVDLEHAPPRRARPISGGLAVAASPAGAMLAAGPGFVALAYAPEDSVLAASPDFPLLLRNAVAHLAGRPPPAPEFATVAEAGGPPGFREAGPPVNLLAGDLALGGPGPSDPLADPGRPETAARPLSTELAGGALALLLVAWLLHALRR